MKPSLKPLHCTPPSFPLTSPSSPPLHYLANHPSFLPYSQMGDCNAVGHSTTTSIHCHCRHQASRLRTEQEPDIASSQGVLSPPQVHLWRMGAMPTHPPRSGSGSFYCLFWNSTVLPVKLPCCKGGNSRSSSSTSRQGEWPQPQVNNNSSSRLHRALTPEVAAKGKEK